MKPNPAVKREQIKRLLSELAASRGAPYFRVPEWPLSTFPNGR
jgi:hypothetical protein